MYTSTFNCTSSATPIIGAAAISVQGVFKANYSSTSRSYLSPSDLRNILTNNAGTISSNPGTDLIGIMPDLAQVIDSVLPNLN